jgi:hypothetical protein
MRYVDMFVEASWLKTAAGRLCIPFVGWGSPATARSQCSIGSGSSAIISLPMTRHTSPSPRRCDARSLPAMPGSVGLRACAAQLRYCRADCPFASNAYAALTIENQNGCALAQFDKSCSDVRFQLFEMWRSRSGPLMREPTGTDQLNRVLGGGGADADCMRCLCRGWRQAQWRLRPDRGRRPRRMRSGFLLRGSTPTARSRC